MKALEERILKDGKVLPGEVLKVGDFLNQQIDTKLLNEMAEEVDRLFKDAGITRVLTIEASGIPLAYAVASQMGVPMVFAKKHKSINLSPNLIKATVFSYTHQTSYEVVVSREHIVPGDKILIVDDFLANGNALLGLMDMAQQGGAEVVGAAIAIEKGFQGGGELIRNKGIHVESLAIIESMTDDSLTFRSQE